MRHGSDAKAKGRMQPANEGARDAPGALVGNR
jgi:hypothetical protein